MTTFNTATINKVKFIAECAHEDCALTTLKNAKDGITNRSKIHAGYESQWQGVDRAEVLECFAQAMDCRTKADFTRRIELLLETMRNMEIEHEKAEERAKIAAATPRTVEAAPVVAEPTAAEVMQITFWGANDYTARRAIVEAAHAEALEIDAQKARNWLAFAGRNVFDTLTNADHRRKAIEEAHAVALAINSAKDRHAAAMHRRDVAESRLASDVLLCIKHDTDNAVEACHAEALNMEAARKLNARQAAFVFHNTAAERAEIIEAAHAEALSLNVIANVQADVIAAPYLPALVAACHAEALEIDKALEGTATITTPAAPAAPVMEAAPAAEHVPAANIHDYPITTLHTAIDAEDGKPYAEKRVIRAYVARSITRALESQQRHAEKYTAQDEIWLAEHHADHAFRNSVITAEEFTAIYHLIRAENARPLATLAAIRDALLSGAPVMPAVEAVAAENDRAAVRAAVRGYVSRQMDAQA